MDCIKKSTPNRIIEKRTRFYILLFIKVGSIYTGPHHTEGFREGLIEIEEEPEKQPETLVSGNLNDL